MFLDLVSRLPRVQVATYDEVLTLVDSSRLYGQGLSLVDAHLVTATLLTPGTSLWTRDKTLRRAATALGIADSYV
ncbi:MAG: hypothetical protein L0H41_03410 [Microlunatus sp.]|nr:hypothetical protein [Microlunatus sp.]